MDESEAGAKISVELRQQMAMAPHDLQPVAVWFATQPEPDLPAQLGLIHTGANPAVGHLDSAAIEAAAERPDVLRITYRPEPQLFDQ